MAASPPDTERLLRENEARLRLLLIGEWAQAVWETDPAGVVVTDSPSWRAYTGQTPEEWLGYGWLDAIHPDDRGRAERQWRDAMATRGLVDTEFRLRAPGGGWRWTAVRAVPVIDADGRIEKWAGMNIDVDARKQAELARRESDRRYRDALDTMTEGFALLDRDFTIVDVNRETVRLDGRARGELVGRSHWDAFLGTERSAVGGLFRKVMAERTPGALEHHYTWTDGRSRWLDMRAYPTPDGGVAIFWRDVTDRKQAEVALRESEERYRALFESMDQAYAVVEVLKDDSGRWHDFRFNRVNPAFMAHTGMPEPSGRTATELLGTPNPRWTQLYGRALDTGEPMRVEEHEPSLDRIFDLNIFALDRAANRVAVLFTDITERRRADAALRESEERQAFLLRLSDALRPLSEGAEIERVAVAMLGRQLGASRAFYATMDEGGDTWSVTHDFSDGLPSRAGRYPLTGFQQARLEQWRAGRMSSVSDSTTDPKLNADERAAYAAMDARAAIGVPLVHAGRFAALLVVNSAVPRDWTEAELVLTRETADRTWAAIERARAEAVLREREAELALTQAIGQVASVDVLLTDPPTGARSLEYRRLHGLPLDAAHETHDDWLARLHPDDRARQDRVFRDAVAGSDTYETEYRIIRPDNGEERWIGTRAVIERDRAGNAIRLRGAHIDITQRKRADRALRDSERRFVQFAEASSDVLWMVNAATGRLDYLSPAFERVWGVSRASVMADLSVWTAMLHPDDRPRAATMLPRALAGEAVVQEYRIVRGDGAIRYITDVGFPVYDDAGNVVRVGGIAQDLTERRLAERRQRALVEGVPQLVWRAVGDGRWTWASPQWTAYTGQSEAASHDRGWLDPVHPDDRAQVSAVWEGAIADGGFHADYRICNAAEHRYRWFQTRATPVRDDEGRIVEWLGTSTDVDDLRTLQERQQVLLAELQHRVRNILAIMRSIMHRSLDGDQTLEDYARHLDGRMDALARTQVLLTRQADVRIDLEDLIREELLAQVADDARVRLAGPELALSPHAAEVLGLAVHELATNAVKYGAIAHPGGALTIEWSVEERDGHPWLVLVWTERGVPVGAGPPPRSGFGSELITRRVPYELHGEGDLEMTFGGILCTIAFPLREGASVLETGASVMLNGESA